MTSTDKSEAKPAAVRTANGLLPAALLDSTELRSKVEAVVTDLANSARKNALQQHKLAKREARALYRQSTRAIKRNPWRTVGLTLLTGVVAGGLFAMTRRAAADDSEA